MKTLVIYDSQFGNTEKVAQVIGRTFSGMGEVAVIRMTEVKPEDLTGLSLLIVGSPTQAFRPTKGMQTFLQELPEHALQDVRVAAFDTRISTAEVHNVVLTGMVKIFGYAAKPMAEALQKKGGKLAAEPEGFYVTDKVGPLKDGELERASAWAGQLVQAV